LEAIVMPQLRKPLVVICLALVAALALESAVLAASVGRNGKTVSAVRTVTSDLEWLTWSESWIDVADMKTFVSVPSGEKALLVITFSAETLCAAAASPGSLGDCDVRVTLDGAVVSPGQVQWGFNVDSGSLPHEIRSMQWIAGPVLQGQHQVKVQGRNNQGGSLLLGPMTLTVLRSKFA
jgi:hypothetical protein